MRNLQHRAVAALLIALHVSSAASATQSASERSETHWFRLYAGPRDEPTSTMVEKLRAGPFPTIAICYAAGSLGIDELNAQNPDKSFAGGCRGDERLDVRELTDRARALLPKD